MIVTSATIGYGDVCPKSRIQMNFFLIMIPIICGSFVVMGNNVSGLWEDVVKIVKSRNDNNNMNNNSIKDNINNNNNNNIKDNNNNDQDISQFTLLSSLHKHHH